MARQKSQTRGSSGAKGTLYCLSESLVCVGHGARAGEVIGLELGDVESCIADELINLAIEVATACKALPERCDAVLPGDHA